MGAAFAGMRDKIVISTKTQAVTAEGMWKDLEESLRALQTEARTGLPVGEPVKGQLPAHAAQRRVLTHLPRAHMPRAGHARRLRAV